MGLRASHFWTRLLRSEKCSKSSKWLAHRYCERRLSRLPHRHALGSKWISNELHRSANQKKLCSVDRAKSASCKQRPVWSRSWLKMWHLWPFPKWTYLVLFCFVPGRSLACHKELSLSQLHRLGSNPSSPTWFGLFLPRNQKSICTGISVEGCWSASESYLLHL